ncbi:mucin-2-like [Dorcoceras hygrometricum]|uniref:Mucin-2-like n=1 Tax=Dorcoceras hygrometricum TaxID=472368 RepID=A0A2Z7BAJ5_9LAMI|nr:mucin-2-like [Dorcoceras hygrometricum]
MASSLISRSHHIDFDSVFRFDDAEMVQMFESLITSGLKEFLGCPAIFYENALTEFFSNGSGRDGLIVSTIGGIAVEISESVFAATFELPTEGLTDLSEVPRNFLSEAQSIFSVSKKEVSISFLKKEINMQYRLLSDILAKSLFVKAGSFDAAKGYAIQICVLLKNIPGLELGESRAFPAPRILNEKTVHRIVSVNENVGVEEVAEAPRAKKTPVKKTMSKKRPAARDAEVDPVITKKRTTKSKPVAAIRISLEKQVEDSSTSDQPVEGVATGEQIPVAGVVTGEQIPVAEDATEDADATIKQVLNQLDLLFEKPDVAQGGLVETWFDKAFDEEFEISDRERQDTEEEIVVGFEKGTSARDQPLDSEKGADGTNDDELLSIEEHQARIPFNASLPSTLAPPITQIRFGQGIKFRDVDAYTPNLPRIDISDNGKGILVEDDMQGHPAREIFSLICADIEFLIVLREKVIEDVSIFVSSFSLRKLASLQSEDIFAKEGQVLSWAETDSSYVAIQRRQFIIAKYRELLLRKFLDARRKNFVSGTPTSAIDLKVLNLLSAAHLFALKDLLRNMKAHQLEWTRSSSSSLFEGPIIDRGSSIPVTHRSISSKCWIRAKIMVDGSWLILEGVDYWRPISTPVNSSHWEALPQRPYIDDLAPLCVFVEPVQDIYSRPSLSRALRVVWAEICMEAIQFSILGCLRPAQSSLPAASVDLSSLLDALQASLCQRMDDANNEFLYRLHSTERSLQTSLGHQNDYLRHLIEGARQEGQTQDDIQLLRLNELRKSVMAHDVKADTDSLDVRNKFDGPGNRITKQIGV